jgi:uncharacterized protein
MAAGTPLADALGGRRYALLTTFRRTGQGVTTTVWFAVAGGAVYFRTAAETGKAKRIRRNNRVRVAPGTPRGRPLGPDVEATARLLAPGESDVARRALEQRYGLQVRLVDLLFRLRRARPIFFELKSV